MSENLSTGLLRMSFKDPEANNEVKNGLDDLEVIKATTKAQQKLLSAALNRARKAEKAKAKAESKVSLLLCLLV
jgi:hypothetical protein